MQLLKPKGLYVVGCVHRVNRQKKKMEFTNVQESAPREFENTDGRLVNKVSPMFVNTVFAMYAPFQCFSGVPWNALFLATFLFQLPESLKKCAVAGGFSAVSQGGCTMKRLHTGGVIRQLHVSNPFSLLFHSLSMFGVFTRRSRQS